MDQQRLINSDDEDYVNMRTREPSCYGGFLDALGKFFGHCCLFTCCGCCCYPYKTINRGNKGVITRFGSVKEVVNDGLHYVNPITETMTVVDMRRHVKKLSNQQVLTKDNLPLVIDGCVYYRVSNTEEDVVASKFGIENISLNVDELAHSTLRLVFAKHTLNECLTNRREFASEMKAILGDQAKTWGIIIEDIQIIDISLPKHIQDLLATGAVAEREAQALLISSRANVQSAELMRQASDLLNTPAAMQMRLLETYKVLAESQNTKVIFLPMNPRDLDNVSANIVANQMQ